MSSSTDHYVDMSQLTFFIHTLFLIDHSSVFLCTLPFLSFTLYMYKRKHFFSALQLLIIFSLVLSLKRISLNCFSFFSFIYVFSTGGLFVKEMGKRPQQTCMFFKAFILLFTGLGKLKRKKNQINRKYIQNEICRLQLTL